MLLPEAVWPSAPATTAAKPTVRYLAERIARLLRLTETRCREKIARLERAPPRPAPPTVDSSSD